MAYMRDSAGRRLDSFEVVGKPLTRKAYMPVTAPNTTNAASVLDIWQRTMVRFPYAVKRYRIGFANVNLRSTATLTTPATITGVFRGLPLYDTASSGGSRWLGQCAAALTSISGALTVPVDGTRVWTAWDTTDIPANTDTVFSMGLTTPATGNGIAGGNGYQGIYGTGSANAANATVTSPQTLASALRLDIVIEYEFEDSVQIGLFIGDSNTVNYGTAPQGVTNSGASALPTEAWPVLAGGLAGFAAVNISVGSATTDDYATALPGLWTRVDLPSVDFDFAVVSLGTNGLSTGLSGFLAAFKTVNDKLRNDYGIQKIYWTTITPRAYPDGAYSSGGTIIQGTLTADAVAGATSLSCTYAPANGLLTIGNGYTMEDVTVSGTSGTGPYTVTTTATANAHYAGEMATRDLERTRQYVNAYLRNLPYGITGAFDFEKLLESAPSSNKMDPRYAASDWLHTTRGAALEKAKLVAMAGAKTRLG
jgi:hypothetical protein